ncbi:MAG: class I SAM-dependent methyltransferase [Alphaproteobacteria bacterium]|nr:class I SAM-dependent methyltransferase [Alphaproteobacteria bacterium]
MTDSPHQAHVRTSAEAYDRYTSTVTPQFDAALAAMLEPRILAHMPDAVLVDIGTGTARFLIHLASMPALAGLRLIGTDLYDDMLDQARKAALQAGAALELTRQDVHRMDLADGMADIVTSRSTIHHWEDPVQAFREIWRILKPGGSAILVDVRRDAPASAVEALDLLRREVGLGPILMEEKYTAAELDAFCAQAGIGPHCHCRTSDDGLHALFVMLTFDKPAG